MISPGQISGLKYAAMRIISLIKKQKTNAQEKERGRRVRNGE
jgi:hypothetical protein